MKIPPLNLLLNIAFLIILLAPAGAQDESQPSNWFTLDVGDIWTFEDDSGRMSIKVLQEEDVSGVKAYRVGWFVGDSETPYQSEYWRKVDGDYLVLGRVVGDRAIMFDQPYAFLKESIQPGDTWTAALSAGGRSIELTFTVGEKEMVQTGVGEFEAYKVGVAGPPQEVERWYVPAVGMVKERTRLRLGTRVSPGTEKTLVEREEG